MDPSSAEVWSLVASVVSVVVSVLAIALAIYFFVSAKTVEKAVSNSLIKIETQAETLQRISGRQLDRLTRYVVDQKTKAPDPQVEQLLTFLMQIAPRLEASVAQRGADPSTDALVRELDSCYIGLYYYSALANYWSQFYLPKVEEFDETNHFHALVQRVTDQSAADFIAMARILEGVESERIAQNPLADLLTEAVGFWRERVRTSAQVFAQRAQNREES